MKLTKNIFKRIVSLVLVLILLFSVTPTKVQAAGLIEELFGISFYNFYYLDENGKEKSDGFYNWGSKDEKEHGIKIQKTSADTIKVVIDADSNETYQKCKPVLMWMHKGDSLFDATKWTDIDLWYKNKLEETFLLCAIPDYTQDCEIEIDVPIKLNLGLTGLINGGYYEIEFYGEGAIPEQLLFAYKAQTYTIEELEEYMKTEMSESIAEYYNVDSGFRSGVNGLSFANTEGVCAGIAAVTTAKYNGYKLASKYKVNDKEYNAMSSYSWYPNVYGDASIHDISLDNAEYIRNNSPFNSEKCYPYLSFSSNTENDEAFYSLLDYYCFQSNKNTALTGNYTVAGITYSNLENRWSIVDYVASYLRQGKAIIVNLCEKDGGHAIVGYRMEQIDEDTVRLYCYDSNLPDDRDRYYVKGANKNNDTNEDGSYKNIVWAEQEVYIDFTKKTIIGRNSAISQKEFEVFEFDSSHTSFKTNSKDGVISFQMCEGEKFSTFNYGSESNEVIAYRAFPVITSDNKVQIRTFAYYKSGEVIEVTNSINTTVKMDYDFIGWYKIKNSEITLTKDGYKFSDSGSKYIECSVTYDNHTDSYGSVQVRIPIS